MALKANGQILCFPWNGVDKVKGVQRLHQSLDLQWTINKQDKRPEWHPHCSHLLEDSLNHFYFVSVAIIIENTKCSKRLPVGFLHQRLCEMWHFSKSLWTSGGGNFRLLKHYLIHIFIQNVIHLKARKLCPLCECLEEKWISVKTADPLHGPQRVCISVCAHFLHSDDRFALSCFH